MVGVILGSVVGCILLSVGGFLLYRRRKNHEKYSKAIPTPGEANEVEYRKAIPTPGEANEVEYRKVITTPDTNNSVESEKKSFI